MLPNGLPKSSSQRWRAVFARRRENFFNNIMCRSRRIFRYRETNRLTSRRFGCGLGESLSNGRPFYFFRCSRELVIKLTWDVRERRMAKNASAQAIAASATEKIAMFRAEKRFCEGTDAAC